MGDTMAMEHDRRTTPRRSCRSVAPAVALLLASTLVTLGDRAEARPAFDVAYNVGSAAYQQGKHALAAEHLSFALRHWPLLSAVAHLKPTAQQRLATSRAHVGALAVTVSAPLAEVRVDGKPAGKAPLAGEIFVEPGEHTVEARLDGYAPALKTVRVAKGETAAVTLTLAATKSDSDAAVKADEKKGTTAAPHGPVAAQPSAKPGSSVPASGAEERGGGPRRAVLIGGAATAGAAAVAGVVFAVLSSANTGDASEQEAALLATGGPNACAAGRRAAECHALRRLQENAATFGNVSAWSFIGAGVAGAATAIVWAVDSRAEGRARLHASPMVGAHEGGIMVRGTW
ncbi:PEGA domain-containing protein [Sorangium sp. So ce145]|uniref:PEGA domain-containing protein n=1 Tax=Sorangium sp. So ce145 TaxID=3133285 RepID=UPI003F60F961